MVYYDNIPIIEGIDKITVTLSPALKFNFSKMKIDPKQRLTVRLNNSPYKFRVYLDIHAEYIKPYIFMEINIAMAIHETIKAGFIEIPFIPDLSTVYYFLSSFVHEVNTLEFFFDILPTNFKVLSPAELRFYGTTIYSDDYRARNGVRKSTLKLYDRATHLKKQNHISHNKIDGYPYKWRFEVVLTKYNCPYLTLNNIQGNYHSIMQKYTKLLAITYNRYFRGKIEFNILDVQHPYLTMILKETSTVGIRYTGDLQKHKSNGISYINNYRFKQFNNKKDNREKQLFYTMLSMMLLQHNDE